jgi:hypothetical protein
MVRHNFVARFSRLRLATCGWNFEQQRHRAMLSSIRRRNLSYSVLLASERPRSNSTFSSVSATNRQSQPMTLSHRFVDHAPPLRPEQAVSPQDVRARPMPDRSMGHRRRCQRANCDYRWIRAHLRSPIERAHASLGTNSTPTWPLSPSLHSITGHEHRAHRMRAAYAY